MRRLLLILEVVVVLIVGTEFPMGQAHATILYPWCAHYLSPNGVQNCGFINWQQCLCDGEWDRRNLRRESALHRTCGLDRAAAGIAPALTQMS